MANWKMLLSIIMELAGTVSMVLSLFSDKDNLFLYGILAVILAHVARIEWSLKNGK